MRLLFAVIRGQKEGKIEHVGCTEQTGMLAWNWIVPFTRALLHYRLCDFVAASNVHQERSSLC
jgi:hypothetical protein